jgi:hypothetical protein
MKIYPENWESGPIKNRTAEVFIEIWANDEKENIKLMMRSKITELLEAFNKQVIETLWDMEVRKELKKSKLKKKIEKIKQKLSSWFSKKQFERNSEIIDSVAWNCAKLLKISKELDESFPPIFANLILHPQIKWGERIITISLRSEGKWMEDLNIENLVKQAIDTIKKD